MIGKERIKEAQKNFTQYLQDRLIKKEKNETAKAMYAKNADLSLNLAEECMNILKLNCKGNGICESGEYGTSDCPNCDDNNKCSADSYDSASKQCIHTEMKGCRK